MLERGITPADLAEALKVDPKSVERWISGRTPYRRHRYAVAARLGVDEVYLWPDAIGVEQAASASESEIINIYPHRWAVPSELWRNIFNSAQREIGVLVYSGLFLADNTGLVQLLIDKARSGVSVRILFGDPDSAEVTQHGEDIGLGEAMAARVRNALVLFDPLRRTDGAEIRLHRTVLYNSIYRADDQLLVNTHVYGQPAQNAPVLHLRRVAGGDMVTTYIASFDRVWARATPVE